MAKVAASKKAIASKVTSLPKSKRPAPQRPSPPTSASGSDASDDEDTNDQAAMLAALEAHSRAMFGLDGPDEAESSTQAQKRMAASSDEEDGGEEFQSDDGWGAEDDFVSDSEDEVEGTDEVMVSEKGTMAATVPEVVFAPSVKGSLDVLSKAEKRAFLTGNSAKMMGIKKEVDYAPGRKRPRTDAEDEDDHSKLKLDKSLHEMLLSNLLPSANADAAQRPVDKRNAIQGRLLELAAYSVPGEGSKSAHETNSRLSAHPAKIRTGIIHAQAKRDEKARKEAELSGNKVRGMGGLGENSNKREDKKRDRAAMGADLGKKKGMAGRKKGDEARDRGLTMGVGRFSNGALRLSESEIARGSNEGRGGGRGGRGGRGRGGRGGRGGKRGKR